MKSLGARFSWVPCTIGLAFGPSAFAQDAEVDWGRVAERVDALAFDPGRFFGDDIRPDVTIAYRTNVSWPVYSIAISRGCLEQTIEDRPEDECGTRWTARMLRAPADPKEDGFRARGYKLLEQLAERQMTTREAMRDRLGSIELEWLEADLTSCPTAQEAFNRLQAAEWVPSDIAKPLDPDSLKLYVHPPVVDVALYGVGGRTTFSGPPDEGTPGEWAEQFYDALEPCWQEGPRRLPWSQ